jgi:two-component system, OmpR family, response regulator
LETGRGAHRARFYRFSTSESSLLMPPDSPSTIASAPGFPFAPERDSLSSAMRILVIEDDKKIASFIVKGLKQNGFAVDHATGGDDGFALALATPYDAAVVDIMLPQRDGLSVVQELRQRKINVPVIILSAKASVDDRIKGLQSGGDDYLVKPFSFSELLARIQALIRRATKASDPTTLAVGDLSLNLVTREVRRASQAVELQAREFALLEYLMRNANKYVSKAMILEHIFDYSFDPQTNVVDVLVCRLRNKIDRDFETKMIQTLRGVGYVLKPG